MQYVRIDARWGCLDEHSEDGGHTLLLHPFLHLRKLRNLKRLDIIIGQKNWDRLVESDYFCEGYDEWMHIWSHVFMWFKYCPPDENCSCCGSLPIVSIGNGHSSWIGLRWSQRGKSHIP